MCYNCENYIKNLLFIMKKILKTLTFIFALTFLFSSCFTYTFSVGKGAQTGLEIQGKNHYLINGLAPVGSVDFKQLAGDAENYDVTITHSFIDGLLAAITFGIYTPTTVIVKK